MVRIQSRKWIKAQKKAGVDLNNKDHGFPKLMQKYAGRTAKIIEVDEDYYHLDLPDQEFVWEDWMFDPDYRPDEPMTPEDAIRAMLDGERLENGEGWLYMWDGKNFRQIINGNRFTVAEFNNLYRRPEKRKRAMNRWEILAWASGEESRGWVVTNTTKGPGYWDCPQCYEYDGGRLNEYRRAKLLPDGSGIDESTIQGFEVEE
jgi:hypothetical protein